MNIINSGAFQMNSTHFNSGHKSAVTMIRLERKRTEIALSWIRIRIWNRIQIQIQTVSPLSFTSTLTYLYTSLPLSLFLASSLLSTPNKTEILACNMYNQSLYSGFESKFKQVTCMFSHCCFIVAVVVHHCRLASLLAS